MVSGRLRAWLRRLPLPPLSIGAVLCGVVTACDLAETNVPSGESVVVVQAVMRPDRIQQYVVVERGYDGVLDPGNSPATVPAEPPQVPVDGAVVTVTNLDDSADPCGATRFDAPPASGFFAVRGAYWSPPGCPSMRPGDRLALRVLAPTGEVITGETVVPGFNGATITLRGATQQLGSDTLEFNRDRDTLGIAVDGSFFRALHIEVRRVAVRVGLQVSNFDRTLLAFADTSAIRLPGTIRDLYDKGVGDPTFLGGRYYVIATGVADTNYFDFARSRNDDITGRGFVNRLTGGIGVFGSLIAVTQPVRVTADQDDPREGRYHLEGLIDTVHVDLTLDVYLARATDSTDASGFVDGAWMQYFEGNPPVLPGWQARSLSQLAVDGHVAGDTLEFAIPTRRILPPPGGTELFNVLVRGVRTPGQPFTVQLIDSLAFGIAQIGTLTATQINP